MAGAATLYTPQVLGLATGLAAWPMDETLPFSSEGRSKTCGSAIALALALDSDGRIARLGLKSQACAIGQAAAAIFADGAPGKRGSEIGESVEAIEAWLFDDGPMPAWPGLDAIAAARDYPARHEAILLPWRVARRALPSSP